MEGLMVERRPRPTGGIYYGWWIVAASFVGLSLCQTPIAFLTLGIFMKPLADAFGWGRGPISLALSFCALTLAFVTPVVGKLIDRFGVRRVMIPSMTGFGLLMASLYWLTDFLAHFYAVYFLLGIVGAGANNVSYMRVISAWFSRNRGLALGIASAGVAFGQAAASIVAQQLIDISGWRGAYLGLGALVLVIGVPIVSLVIRDRPPETGQNPELADVSRTAGQAAGMSTREALSTPMLWAIVAIAFLIAVSLHGIQIHLVPLLTDRGVSADFAAGGFTILAAVSIIFGRVGVGFLFDRFFAPRVSILAFAFPAFAMIALLLSNSALAALSFACMMGLGMGAESDVLGYLTGRYFGLRCFGQIYGYVFGAFMIGTAIGPYLYGATYDWTHSYSIAISLSVLLIGVMCMILACLPRFPHFSRESEVAEGVLPDIAFRTVP
jgi:MFS family permease